MSTEVVVPALGESVTEATVAGWLIMAILLRRTSLLLS